ncbi:hypothetical protein J5X84_34035 [Streptosporangiaceae bacterium NEAU-GS5]|nr:hypothetical protein [Streptosporangiaceae bacterium NEAU-GS5]
MPYLPARNRWDNYQALGLALLTVTPGGITRITVFGDLGLVVKSGLPSTPPGSVTDSVAKRTESGRVVRRTRVMADQCA